MRLNRMCIFVLLGSTFGRHVWEAAAMGPRFAMLGLPFQMPGSQHGDCASIGVRRRSKLLAQSSSRMGWQEQEQLFELSGVRIERLFWRRSLELRTKRKGCIPSRPKSDCRGKLRREKLLYKLFSIRERGMLQREGLGSFRRWRCDAFRPGPRDQLQSNEAAHRVPLAPWAQSTH